MPGESIDTPSNGRFISHKFDFIYSAFRRHGWSNRLVLDIYTRVPRVKAKYRFSTIQTKFLFEIIWVVIRFSKLVFTADNPFSFVNQLALRRTYRSLLLKYKPTVVLSIGASEALVDASRAAGIRCVEIQHGMFGPEDVLRYWPTGVCPDSFLTWDHFSSQVAQEFGINAWEIGHPDVHNPKTKAAQKNKSGDFVCVSLGYGMKESEDSWGCVPSELKEVVDMVMQSGIPVIFRVHPIISANRRKFKGLEKWIKATFGEVRIDNPRMLALHDSIADSFLNICCLSSTWYDFALRGRPSIVIDRFWENRYDLQARSIGIWGNNISPIIPYNKNQSAEALIETARNRSEVLAFTDSGSIDEFIRSLADPGNLEASVPLS